MTKKDIAVSLGISKPTFSKWLKPYEKQIGKRKGYNYTPKQVEKIYNIFGNPKKLK